jgi:hypothetical protein
MQETRCARVLGRATTSESSTAKSKDTGQCGQGQTCSSKFVGWLLKNAVCRDVVVSRNPPE